MKRMILALLAALTLAAGTGFASPEEKTPLVLSLDDCLRLALERNPAYLAARETEPGARARRNEAAAQFFPSLDAQGTNIVSKKPFEIVFPSMVPRSKEVESNTIWEFGSLTNAETRTSAGRSPSFVT